MASVRKHPASSFWSACFSVYSGSDYQRWNRSLRTRDQKLARRIADALEQAGRGVLSERDIVSFIDSIVDGRTRRTVEQIFWDVFRSVHGRQFGAGSLRAFAESWVSAQKTHLSPRSHPNYERAIQSFITFLGKAADRDLIGFGPRDDVLVIQFRDHLADRLSPGSVNDALKIVRMLFKAASQRFKIDNPAHLVPGVRTDTAHAAGRRAFTLPELGRILRVARNSEWEGLILAGLYTGQRLSDIALFRWENVDLVRHELTLTTRKTNRRILIPLAGPLADYITGLPAGDDPKEFIFPKAAAFIRRSKTERAGALSNQFHDILAQAGLVRRRSHRKAKDGRGRSAQRRPSEISFHSFRHSTTSLLKNAGIPQAVVMDLCSAVEKNHRSFVEGAGEDWQVIGIFASPEEAADTISVWLRKPGNPPMNPGIKKTPGNIRGAIP